MLRIKNVCIKNVTVPSRQGFRSTILVKSIILFYSRALQQWLKGFSLVHHVLRVGHSENVELYSRQRRWAQPRMGYPFKFFHSWRKLKRRCKAPPPFRGRIFDPFLCNFVHQVSQANFPCWKTCLHKNGISCRFLMRDS